MFNIEKFKNYSFYFLIGIIFLVGVFIRTNLYINGTAFEDDECRLAITMLDKNLWQMFLPLGDAQSAPPIFMFLSKILANLFGYEERVLHFIPYVASIASLGFFYRICKNYFSKKLTTLFATFLFAINLMLISYAFIFKQYSLDVLIGLICINYFPQIDIKSLNVKKLVLLSIALMVLPLISLPSLFFIFGLFILNLIKNYKEKEFYAKSVAICIPFVLLMSIYYWNVLLPSKIDLDLAFPNYWENGFWNFSIFSLVRIITFNFLFDFAPNKLMLFIFILFVLGFVGCVLDKKDTQKTSYFITVVLVTALLASLFNIYPMVGRVALYLTPIFLLFILRPLDIIKNKIGVASILLMIILGFVQYSPNYLYSLRNDNEIVKYAPESLMQVLIDKFNPKEDIILCNSASVSSFLFYSSRNKLYTDNVREMDIRPATREAAKTYFNGLKKNQKYWFYLIKDYEKDKVFPFILDELEKKDILYLKKDRDSMLIYVQN